MKPVNTQTETQEGNDTKKNVPYLRTMYLWAIIIPYCFVVHALFNETTYSTATQFCLSIVLGISWHTAACPLFYKKLGNPYSDSLLSMLFIAFQYTVVTLALFFLISYLSASQAGL